ncbi:MAG: hypothetical protein ACRDD1_16205, partial [Planctomycetia bacterium]
RPAALLLSGHTSPSSTTLLERPGTAAYQIGAADYPGLNLRLSSSFNAISRIANVETAAYPLDPTAKYYLRDSGVSGRHASSSTTPITLTALGGANFTLSALNLAFLDGINTASGVNGSVTIPAPANFSLSFRRLLFGAQGQLQEATIASPQADKTLGFWNMKLTPLALDFPQPKTCPPPSPATAFIRLTAQSTLPGLTATPVVGQLGFFKGDLVTESYPIANGQPLAFGNGAISRFEPGGLLTVPGPDSQNWAVSPIGGILLNRHRIPDGNDNVAVPSTFDDNPTTPTATLTAPGLMNLPFFNDMEVVLNLNSTDPLPNTTPQIHVRKPYEPLTNLPFDAPHAGVPI